MTQSSGRFAPPNLFSKIAWSAVWAHVEVLRSTNIIGLYNCKIFYSTYISLISSYTNLSNTDNVELYLNKGLEEFFLWARINKNKFKSDSERFISYYSNDLIDPYTNHFASLFFNEIKSLNPIRSYNDKVPFFMLLFDVDSPKDDKVIYDDQYFFDHDIDSLRIDKFFEVINSNFKNINTQFDLLLEEKVNLKLESWIAGQAAKMIADHNFLENLVVKPFHDSRCQMCGNFTSREKLSLNVEREEGWILPMCLKCKLNNI